MIDYAYAAHKPDSIARKAASAIMPGRTAAAPPSHWLLGVSGMANSSLQPGLTGQRETVVSEQNIAPHVRKFSTPSMIRLMEGAATAAVQPYLPEGHVSVGFEVNIRHIAPADIGSTVIAYAELLEVDRNHLAYRVEAYEGGREGKKIGEGTHRRTIIPLNR